MIRHVTTAIAAIALAGTATVAHAQDEPEEPRTTYEVTMIDIAPGMEDRFFEMDEQYGKPAREAAGVPDPVVHWIMTGSDYDLMIVREMPEGMAGFDTHVTPVRTAYREKLLELAGSEEALAELNEERRALVTKSTSIYTHTHP